MNVIECVDLGKRYRRAWALRDCTLGFPAGHVVALVGPWMKALLKALG